VSAVLVTGGAGFIGGHFVRALRRLRPDRPVVNLDLLTYAGTLDALAELQADPGHRFVRGDICDGALVERLIAEHGVTELVHFAAESHVDRSIAEPSVFLRTNVLGTQVLLEAARRAGLRRFVHVSTDEVYGHLGPDDPPFTERTPLHPRSPYAASKAASDHLALAWHQTYGLDVVITRCSNNYGPWQYPEKLIPVMVQRALDHQPLPVYGTGGNVRDWIHVDDHCAGVLAALERGRAGEVYNFGARTERANLDVVQQILAVLDRPRSLISFVPDRLGHDWRYAMDATKAEAELGWAPRREFTDALAETVEWYVEHAAWWRPHVAGARR
jgi:dTDP-glucose 4,6-dehydratase